MCETQGRGSERVGKRERERLRGRTVRQTGRQMDRNLALGNMILPERVIHKDWKRLKGTASIMTHHHSVVSMLGWPVCVCVCVRMCV